MTPANHILRQVLRLWLAVTVSLALAASALAHRAPVTADDLALTAFLASGGTVSDLCGEAGHSRHAGTAGCDACRLVGAALVPPAPATAPMAATRVHRITPVTARPCPPPAPRRQRHTPRAPPAG
ncbi:hypothetical protein [Oceaniglobus trochenteri]|uniref:hypothetical protein n=1 Tax=Oceaniglobus trochenteri TaxID=2763260 RepID=UPI001CFFBB98|nr:hypothetical protein [Oceaniglobus trochenteri]